MGWTSDAVSLVFPRFRFSFSPPGASSSNLTFVLFFVSTDPSTGTSDSLILRKSPASTRLLRRSRRIRELGSRLRRGDSFLCLLCSSFTYSAPSPLPADLSLPSLAFALQESRREIPVEGLRRRRVSLEIRFRLLSLLGFVFDLSAFLFSLSLSFFLSFRRRFSYHDLDELFSSLRSPRLP